MVFIIDDDICTRCALCVDRCPTGVIILGKVGTPRRAATATAHQQPRLRLRHEALGDRRGPMAKIIDDKPRPTMGDRVKKVDRQRAGQPGVEPIFRPGSIFRKGYTDSPRNRSLRDHELGAVPPAPGQGEAPRGEGQLHAVPRRPELLPLHPAHRHRHLPDVLLPARPRARPGTTSTTCRPRSRSGCSCATCTDGARTSWCCRCSCTWPASSTTAPTSRPRVQLGDRRRSCSRSPCCCRSPATCCRGTSWRCGRSRWAPT